MQHIGKRLSNINPSFKTRLFTDTELRVSPLVMLHPPGRLLARDSLMSPVNGEQSIILTHGDHILPPLIPWAAISMQHSDLF